jgi:hypothetical protein
MATDFFGHNRIIKSEKQLSSSEYARISVGGRIDLAQNVTANYGQQIRPLFEIGAPSVFFVTGHAQGTVSVGRLVGKDGFFSNFKGTQCGRIEPVSITGGGGGPCAGGGGGTISFDGGIIESVSLQITAGQIEMTEGVVIRVASMNA